MLSLLTINSVSANEVTINDTNSQGIKGAISNGNTTINLEEGIYTGEKNSYIIINAEQNITIQSKDPNNKAKIDGENINSFLRNNGNLTIKNLIIKNCIMTDLNGGSICNNANLKIINCIFINNMATDGLSSSIGGAIHNKGINSNLTIENSTFINNYAPIKGGAIANNGGNANITGSTFIENRANYGGAIWNVGTLNVSYSYFINNNDKNNNTINNGNGIIILDFNWWGSNSNPNSKINGFTVNNYYTININELKAPSILENALYKINFVLNGTNNTANSENLPKITFNININGYFLGNYQYNENISIKTELGKNIISFAPIAGIDDLFLTVGEESYNIIFDIEKINSQITIDNGNTTLNEIVMLKVTLKDINNNPLSGKLILFFVNNVNVGNATTDINGIATFKYLINIPNGNYNVNAIFEEDDFYMGYSNSAKMVVNKLKSVISLNSIKGNYGQTITLTTKLTSNGKILANKKVNFYANGKLIGTATTNKDGIAKLKYKIPSVAKYTIKTVFIGDSQYNKIESTKTFTSTKAKVAMELKNKLYKKQIYVKIKALGKPLKNKVIK